MKRQMNIAVLTLSLLVAPVVWSHEMPVAKPASPSFQEIQQLVGKWQGTSSPMEPSGKPGPVATEFHLTAGGSAIEENLMKGTPHEMVDMYVDEGGKVAMTHYCAMGNQPHMVLKNSTPHEVDLEMVPTAGIDPNSMHMHSLTLAFADADHLTERWTNYTDGKPGETVVFNMTRVK